MAKLNSYYTLCPLIDQENLLGVERDSDPGCAIVTLGRNIVMRYKLQDLKQISSWSTEDRFTTQVIYDKSTNRYAAVFNEKKIRVWTVEETDLNNVKGHKFKCVIHTILSHNDLPPVLVQQNGATASLKWALENRKSWASNGILKHNEELLDCQLVYINDDTSFCALTKTEQTYYCIMVKLHHETFREEISSLKRIELKRTSENLVGHVVMHTKNGAYFLTLWSHGRLYSHLLTGTSSDNGSKTLVGVINNINTEYPVVMTALNETTLAAYGADVSEEGAILMIYNVEFKLVQATQKLKLYTKDAKLWKVEDKLLLAANRHLAIAPYHLAPQKLETMLGSSLRFGFKTNKSDEDDVVEIREFTVANWEGTFDSAKPTYIGIPRNISKQITSYVNEGLSDSAIQKILIPELIESKDIKAIEWCLINLKDLPEKILVDLIVFALRTPNKVFAGMQNGDSTESASCIHSRNSFLDKIFSIRYSDVSLLPYLSILNLDEVLKLIEYLIDKLDSDERNLDDSFATEEQLCHWTNLLFDSHYQQCILSQSEEVLTMFNKLSSVLDKLFEAQNELQNLRPLMSRMTEGKSLNLSSAWCDKLYSIEGIKFY